MKMKDFSWQAFHETGDIDAYLLYKAVENSKRDEEWKASKQEELSQGAENTVNQTVC